MTKTWTITQEHTVLMRLVVEGATEEEAMENYRKYKFACPPEQVDEYDEYFIAIEEDIPDA